jgi:hypothetical protein
VRRPSLVAALWLLAMAGAARAQTAPPPAPGASTGIAADRFVPGIGPLTLLSAEGAEVTASGRLSWQVAIGYLRDPIRLTNGLVGGTLSMPVRAQLNGDLALEVGVFKRVAVSIGLPFVLYADGDRLRGTGVDEHPLAGGGGGDARLRVKVALLGNPDRLGLHVAALLQVTVPFGGQSNFAATSTATVEPRLIADIRLPHLLFCAQVGVRFQGERSLFLTRFGDELTWVAGAGVDLVQHGRFGALAMFEAGGLVGPSDGTRPTEVRGGVRALLGGFTVDVGAGGGVVSEVASPAWRVFAILRHRLTF